ncbi:sensor histidine kinase [Fulvivirga sp. M361]|uniref:sensor histidine kinase n=1 Tax=Fulvivirga sp. M361 TaxID=2594266 RepID=UPI00117BB469|nr:sensor histidine kinase [Fulvivirga sp. M361]TRX58706.1 sensor histidine kinase [Fulvivirga sp. M361]
MTDEVLNLVIILVIGTSVTLFLSIAIISFVVYYQKRMLQIKMERQTLESEYQSRLLQATLESQEKERKRLASELHDGVGAMLSATKLSLNFLKKSKLNNDALESVSEAKDMIDDAIDTVRRISKDLLPASLEKFGLSEALREFCDKVSSTQVNVIFNDYGIKPLLERKDELPVYRVVQEIVNNALKHAQAKNINIIIRSEGYFDLTIDDDGKGFNIEAVKSDINKGVGLYNIENRVKMLKGTMDVKSEAGIGTTYKITIKNEQVDSIHS